LSTLANSLGVAGQRAQGMDFAKDAVELRRELAAGNREAYLPALASSLTNLAIDLAEAGLEQEARAAAEEANQLRREGDASDDRPDPNGELA
jgi:hypothetical protein